MSRIALCLALLLLAGCSTTPQHADRQPGCRLLPALDVLKDARMQSLEVSQDAAGCRIVGRAPQYAIADAQQQALAAIAAANCDAAATPGEIQQIDQSDATLQGFTLQLRAPATHGNRECTAPAKATADDATIDVSSRHMHPPSYPAQAVRRGIEGRVVLAVLVDGNGRPAGMLVHASSGDALLDDAALRAAVNWRFHRGGGPAQPPVGLALVPVDFRLQ